MKNDNLFAFPAPASVTGTVLLAAGLNNRPEILDGFVEPLSNAGQQVYRIAFRGHTGPWPKDLRASDWTSQLKAAISEIKICHPELPLSYLGYSLGALVITELLDIDEQLTLERLIFLAPPFALRMRPKLLRYLKLLVALIGALPSLTPEEYRAHPTTSYAAYRALFALIDRNQHLSQPTRLGSISTKIFLDPDDELVSQKGLVQWKDTNSLRQWKLRLMPRNFAPLSFPHHLIVDEQSLGKESWRQLVQEVVQFLK